MLAPAGPAQLRPWAFPVPDLGAAAQRESTSKVASCEEEDALNPASAIHENVIASPDLIPRSPSPLPVIDVATTGHSHSSLDAEHAEHVGDHPQRPSYGQDDIA